jgi:4-diphosphocytidyl-2-C-methyl-D-erythritol kinase
MGRPDEPAPNTIVVEARAKINLFLRVLGRRDDGFHDLESLIVPIDLADRLEVHAVSDPTEFRTLSLSLEVTGEESLARGVPADESNLVLGAASALADRAQVRGFADIRLEKRIPPAAGLGGGSADAAATLKALNDLWACGLDVDALFAIAAAIGSDVPALLAGGAVFVAGRGERVEPVRMAGLNAALASFSFEVSTADAFRWWDEDDAPTGPDPAKILREADRRVMGERRGDLEAFGSLLYNDLEGPAVRQHPVIGDVKQQLLEAGAVAAVMSGSGPSVAALLPWEMQRLDHRAQEGIERTSGGPLMYVASEPFGSAEQ